MKEFFSKVWVQVVAWICLILSAIVLIIGGVTGTEINNAIEILIGIISAIGALIAFIGTMIKKHQQETTGK